MQGSVIDRNSNGRAPATTSGSRRLLALFGPRGPDAREDLLAGPLRGELLGAGHLADRAQALAGEQIVATPPQARKRTPLLARLDETRRILEDAHTRLTSASDLGLDIGPAGDWLLDNYYVVLEHITAVQESLPRSYYRELPELASGPLTGYPRVYELTITLISHSEGRVTLDNISAFVEAFQKVSPLTVGELWAVPAMLRLGLIENVRRMARRTLQRLHELVSAEAAAARIARAGESDREALDDALADFAAHRPRLTPTFVSRFLHHLRIEGGALPVILRLEQWIAEEALSSEEATARAAERLALTQVGMANSITSLRTIARVDWRPFVESQSRVEAALREDPSGFYPRMTFATRDLYRHVVERVAKRTDWSEESVARHAIECARAGMQQDGKDPRRAHVGYYLIDDGLAEIERTTGYRPRVGEAVHRWVRLHPNVVFVGGVFVATIAALAAVTWLGGSGASEAWPLLLLLGFLPATDIAVHVVNQLVTAFLPPRLLPKLDLRKDGVPPEFRTAVVVPTLLESVESVREALENLEVQFLANRQEYLHFAVLSDFADSPTETLDGDGAILDAAVEGVRALNIRYADGDEDEFYLFHRPRRWNPSEGVWMGWERKRGKLGDFNRFVLGASDGPFTTVVGDVAAIRKVRYVITLDADTVLPPDTALLLVGALAHPLNRAVYDEAKGRVVRGYGILQPRVGISVPSAHRSAFASIHSGHPGVDPYTTAVSDVYQDLYGEGSFTGKGVYDVEAFERATSGRFPENALLSHDLIEGSYARAGLATDIVVYDDYPSHYLTFTQRKHRWIRGDWQLLPWLDSKVPGPNGPERNRLSVLSRWKIVDNLRRSTVELALLAFFVAGWIFLGGSPVRWTLLGLGAMAAPWIVATLLAVLRPPPDKSWRTYYGAVARDARTSIHQVALAVVFLPHQAWSSVDAIVRTLWRLYLSRRHLLEWRTASQIERGNSGGSHAIWREMAPPVAIGGMVLLAAGWRVLSQSSDADASVWSLAVTVLPFVALWMASPMIAHRLGSPAHRRERRVARADRRQAMRFALLHWRFFDRFVNEESNWLVPDNFQEDPVPIVALRTSPTNIGLQLLATASARDLGFVTLDDMARRLELALRSLERMRRFRGHFYNWYGLTDLNVLEPAYISTVDSGNLAAHLIALRQACFAMIEEPVLDTRAWRALATALALAQAPLRTLVSDQAAEEPALRRALASATEYLRSAHAAAEAAGAYRASTGSLSDLVVPLEGAQGALTQVVPSSEAVEAAAGWISWSLHLIADHQRSAVRAAATPLETLRGLAKRSSDAARLVTRLEAIADRAFHYAMEMEFGFLFDSERKLFAIGFQESNHSLDPSHYDLLASEARLASFIAVAKKDVPVEHWFRLGRTLTYAGGEPALVSWSGSMFEYLMPMLVTRSFPSTVLANTCEGAVSRQMAYGVERGVPWGMSESAYNVRDHHDTYQYRGFGVPDLALKRGLGRELVVAPYASALAAMVVPGPALANLGRLERMGALGPFGFRDALDYTRPDPGQRHALVGVYMAHHLGMGLVALTNVLKSEVWQRRFHADPMVRSAELLLHERIPRRLVPQEAQKLRAAETVLRVSFDQPAVREITTPDTALPHIALLGHLPYTVMLTSCGGGYSRYESLAVTRWQSDGSRDSTGQFLYVRHASKRRVWSAAHQPVCAPPDSYSAYMATDRVTFHRTDGDIETHTEVAVVPEDSAEVRRVTVTNNGEETCDIELTSYGEIVLALPEADRVHPAFGNLFIETEWHEWCSAITATRRPRSANERALWCVHVVDAGKDRVGPVTCETDRARFLGRGRTTRDPVALEVEGPLSGTTGAVLDPIFAIRTQVRLAPRQSSSVSFTTFVATSRERVFELAGRYHEAHAAQRGFDLAWTSSQVEMRELGLTPNDAAVFQELAGHLFFGNPVLRAPRAERHRNRGSQSLLWSMGLSGDWPILLATIESADGIPTVRHLLTAQRFWRLRGVTVDLVILNAHAPTYLQDLGDTIQAAVYSIGDSGAVDRPGGVYVRRRDLLGADELLMLRATARVHIPCDGRPLDRLLSPTVFAEDQPDKREEGPSVEPRPPEAGGSRVGTVVRRLGALPSRLWPVASPVRVLSRMKRLAEEPPIPLDNGFGGLTADGDYAIKVAGDRLPPAPWSNVIANRHGGFVVTERGGGFTWAGSSYLFRLTPWHNDPVSDPVSEVVYLRDLATEETWCPTPGPIRKQAPYTIRHGAGASIFEHEQSEIATHLTLGMADGSATKISLLRVTNHSARTRRLAVTTYVEWTLGVLREHTQHQVRTEFDSSLGAMFAQNTFDAEFAGWTAFHTMSERVVGYTGSRRGFLGRNGNVSDPAALRRAGTLTGITSAGIDPCASLQCEIDLSPGESRLMVIALGAAESGAAARRAVEEHRNVASSQAALERSVAAWAKRLSVITVRTPEPTFDAMLNRWMLYQALGCRLWARSAVYQSSGAFGFRDQLQDVMACVYAEPGLAREHILHATGRQFIEGDVQHWWHPLSGKGVRTRFSDDLAWLPYVVAHYVRTTGDASVLSESVPFLTMRALEPHEDEVYDRPTVSEERGTVYEHCVRALRRACTSGTHGLPLIGSGDWNDGMNRVGTEGRGESVWLGWFLVATLREFAEQCEALGAAADAAEFRARADVYVAAVEEHGWDGAWYRRAYYDDGTPIGSAGSDECRIDSIAQSWSVLSKAGNPERQAQAMRAFEDQLVREDARLLLLLTPPFNKTARDPGYIKGYLPGIRENGAQYTHAALWAVLATAMRGDGDRAFELYQMLNPLSHARTREEVATYKVEPYVVAADVYAADSQLGRGGWTWYTGSASWMYRVGLEGILGLTKRGDKLFIEPSAPARWPEYTIEYRYGGSLYVIVVRNPEGRVGGGVEVSMDGRALGGQGIRLVDDGQRHDVSVRRV